jgi:hypothetical protein
MLVECIGANFIMLRHAGLRLDGITNNDMVKRQREAAENQQGKRLEGLSIISISLTFIMMDLKTKSKWI